MTRKEPMPDRGALDLPLAAPELAVSMCRCEFHVASPSGGCSSRRFNFVLCVEQTYQIIREPAVWLVVSLSRLDYRSRRLSNRFAVKTSVKCGKMRLLKWEVV